LSLNHIARITMLNDHAPSTRFSCTLAL
jgi:hypothetical protein